MLADFYLAFNISSCIIDGFKGGMIKYKEWHGSVCRAVCGIKTFRTLSLNTAHTLTLTTSSSIPQDGSGVIIGSRGTVTSSQPPVAYWLYKTLTTAL